MSRDLARACREYLNAKGGTGVDEVGALLPQVKLALLRMDAGAGAWGGQGEVGTRRLRGYGVESGCNVGDLLRVYHRLDEALKSSPSEFEALVLSVDKRGQRGDDREEEMKRGAAEACGGGKEDLGLAASWSEYIQFVSNVSLDVLVAGRQNLVG